MHESPFAAAFGSRVLMTDVFYLRPMDPPVQVGDLPGMVEFAAGCFDLHHVDWKHSFLSADGRRMLCWYQAPDAESARLALRELGSNLHAVWTGKVTGEGAESPSISTANLLAELIVTAPLSADDVAARVAALEREGVTVVRGILSSRGTQWLGLLKAHDEQAARSALQRAGLSAELVWSCTPVTPKAAGAGAAHRSSNPS
jgi:hypothetical protein